jgi:6-phosphogluconolactonase (cycloisomerase 2 family)
MRLPRSPVRILAGALLLSSVLMQVGCGGGSGSPAAAVPTDTAGTDSAAPPVTPASAPSSTDSAPPETTGLPTAAAATGIAAGALRFALDQPPWSTHLRVSVANPLDGSLRTLFDYAPADLGLVEIDGARADPLHRFVYLMGALPPPRYDFNPVRQLFVLRFDSSTGQLGTPTAVQPIVATMPEVFTPDGQFAYSAAYNVGIDGYRIGVDGQLAKLAGAPFANDLRTSQLRMHPSGQWLLAPSVGTSTQATALFYRIDPQTGALTAQPAGVAPSDLGFVALQGSDRLWWQHQRGQPYTLYSFDATTGALAAVAPTVTIPDLGNGSRDMRVVPDPSSNLLLTERPLADPYASELQAWRLGAGRNAVTAVGAPLAIRFGGVTPDPVGGLFRASDIVLRIDPDQGVQLVAVSPVPTANERIVAENPGELVDATFAIDAAAHRLRALAIDPATGALAQVGTSVPLTGTPTALVVSPRLDYVAVASAGSTGSGTLSVFRIDRSTAALTLAASAATGAAPSAVTVPTAQPDHILVAKAAGIDSFKLGQDGTLTRVQGSPFPPGFGPSTVTTTPDGSTTLTEGQPLRDLAPKGLIATDHGDLFVLANRAGQGGVSTLFVQPATGTFNAEHTGNYVCTPSTPRTGSTFTPTGADAVDVGMAGSSRWIYVVNRGSATVSGFLGNEQPYCGLPDPWVPVMTGSPFATPSLPVGIAIGQSARFAYVAHASGGGSVSAYAIDAGTGALSPLTGSPVALGMVPARIWTDTFGRFVYTADATGKVMVQTIDRATGLPGAPRSASAVPIATFGIDVVLSAR